MNNDNTLSNMMNLAKLFSPPATSNTKTASHDKAWPMFPLDAEIHTEALRVCKSLIPYLPLKKQKDLSIFIKVYELMSVINYYSAMDEPNISPNNFRESETWQMDLLHSVKENLDPSNAYWVDILFKFNDVKNILSSVQSGDSYLEPTNIPAPEDNPQVALKGTSQEFIQNISPMLDDNQKKFLETLSTIMT